MRKITYVMKYWSQNKNVNLIRWRHILSTHDIKEISKDIEIPENDPHDSILLWQRSCYRQVVLGARSLLN